MTDFLWGVLVGGGLVMFAIAVTVFFGDHLRRL